MKARLSGGNGSFETADDIVGYYAFRTEFLKGHGQPKDMVLFDVSGDSMVPVICHGDTVLIDQSQVDIIPGNIYGIGIGEEIVVKRIDKIPGRIVLISENREKYPPVGVGSPTTPMSESSAASCGWAGPSDDSIPAVDFGFVGRFRKPASCGLSFFVDFIR